MPEAMPASRTGDGALPAEAGSHAMSDRARLAEDVHRVADALVEALEAVPLERRAVVAEHLSAAMQHLARVVGDVLRRSSPASPGATAAPTPPAAHEEAGARFPPVADVPPAPRPPARAEPSAAPDPESSPGRAGPGIDATTSLAARLVAQARLRRGVYGDPSRGVLDDPDVRPPPQVVSVSVAPFSDEPGRPNRRRGPGCGSTPVGASEPGLEPGAVSDDALARSHLGPGPGPGSGLGPGPGAGTGAGPDRRADPVEASLRWAVGAGRAAVVGFADVVGASDPGAATRLLQTRVLGALQPGDVAVMVGPGEVVFALIDADLVEVDRRFRHLVVPPTGAGPAVRLGFVAPRAGEVPVEVVARARTAATSRWARLRAGRPA